MSRLTKDEYLMSLAILAAERSTCLKRRVGCVLSDKHGYVLASGYNGAPVGLQHCKPDTCTQAEAGHDLDVCRAVHAEQNALLQCRDANRIDTIYTTTYPCNYCLKLLINTSCNRIVFRDLYSSSDPELWIASGVGRSRSRFHLQLNNIKVQIIRG